TTRDLVSETIEIDGIPLRFVDTAGIREAFDEAEAIGVAKSLEAAAESDLALLVLDGSVGLNGEDLELIAKLSRLDKLIVVVNKSDLAVRMTDTELRPYFDTRSNRDGPVVFVSALRKEGIERLRQSILEAALPAVSGGRETQCLTNLRHEQEVKRSA